MTTSWVIADKWDKLKLEDIKAIGRICKKAFKIFPDIDTFSLEMDLTAVHVTTPLNLEKLESFPNGDLLHDIFGISNHLDRATGELKNCFWPRCSSR